MVCESSWVELIEGKASSTFPRYTIIANISLFLGVVICRSNATRDATDERAKKNINSRATPSLRNTSIMQCDKCIVAELATRKPKTPLYIHWMNINKKKCFNVKKVPSRLRIYNVLIAIWLHSSALPCNFCFVRSHHLDSLFVLFDFP